MRGFSIDIDTVDNVEDFRFRLYDNNLLVVDNIGMLNFEYLVADDYSGEHVLTLTYFREAIPSVESIPQEFFRENFTLPTLMLTITVETF